MSGVGKGIAAASIANIISSRGISVTSLKIDPYVNVDAGTMNPTEHGEVFVLDDGTECDQDMGNYERFLNRDLSGANYMTTGSVYLSLINRERNLEFAGKCVEVVPHVPLEVIDRINKAAKKEKASVAIIEIGGTVGEYQNILFLEAVRMLKIKDPSSVVVVLVSYLPQISTDSEPKTKPTQYAVRTLNSAGVQPDIILARAPYPIDKKRKEKIAFNCNLKEEDIISAPDIKHIYEVPLNFEKDHLSDTIIKKLRLKPRRTNNTPWQSMVRKIHAAKQTITIGIVGKYFDSGSFVLADSYISVIEAVKHAATDQGLSVAIEWLNAQEFEEHPNNLNQLKKYAGIIVPGGFGSRGVEGKIAAIGFCRKNNIPFLGLCYGMQLAVIEFARAVCGLQNAHTTEIDKNTPHPVIDIMPEQKELIAEKKYGATMRLGAYPAIIAPNTIAASAYKKQKVSERHRHRFEVNPQYKELLEKHGLRFSGTSPDGILMEITELPTAQHPFFIATQFHPELKSKPLSPHPLFCAFIKASKQTKNNTRGKQQTASR
ncbi:MAG: synthetase, synthase [Candidatus Parcubacteria bacterium]